jgi:hypothetical protein
MVKINPSNVVKLLYDEIASSFYKSTPVTAKEIELNNHLKGKYILLYISYL